MLPTGIPGTGCSALAVQVAVAVQVSAVPLPRRGQSSSHEEAAAPQPLARGEHDVLGSGGCAAVG